MGEYFLLKAKIQKERKMKTIRLVLSLLVGLVLVATACSPQAAATPVPVKTEPPAVVPVTGGTTVSVGKNDSLRSFLVDDKGMTLYLFTKDTANVSNCYDKCATSW